MAATCRCSGLGSLWKNSFHKNHNNLTITMTHQKCLLLQKYNRTFLSPVKYFGRDYVPASTTHSNCDCCHSIESCGCGCSFRNPLNITPMLRLCLLLVGTGNPAFLAIVAHQATIFCVFILNSGHRSNENTSLLCNNLFILFI